ncbi:hypothetical protein Micbo1qcDRAFT_30289 [Microdochium bolleyi]|uniref:Ubiquitin-like domain-containing protein n=1 Tax=Microdochium bolleyi TaxID=196109 RepID=A0A136JFR3_9PEZI|nr:hypothetical protein Micbo1qcDRAFT_30289 [Microdochium bolleyi]
MADSAVPQTRKLPFKRTVKRKPVEETPTDKADAEDDGLDLFKRSREFFPSVLEDQKKEAAEKAAKAEQQRQEALADEERRKREDAARWASRTEQPSDPKAEEREGSSPKRRRTDSDWDSDDDATSRPSRVKSSPPSSNQSTRRQLPRFSATPAKTPSTTTGHAATKNAVPIISLDVSDDDDVHHDGDYLPPRPRSKRHTVGTHTNATHDSPTEVQVLADDSPPPEAQDKVSDEFDIYVQRAKERAQREREARLTGIAGTEDPSSRKPSGPIVEVLVASRDDTMVAMSFKVRIDQKLEVMFDTWRSRQPDIPSDVLTNAVFTWKESKVWPNTTLATLGIQPDSHGGLYNRWDKKTEGFDGSNGYDKVFFEVWTPEQYEHHEQAKEYQRLRALGEIEDDYDAHDSYPSTGAGGGISQQNPGLQQEVPEPEEKKVRIILKPKQLPSRTLTVKSSTEVAMLIKVFCKMSELPLSTKIEIHWDGEVLDPGTTVEEADIGDMDSVEVHLK